MSKEAKELQRALDDLKRELRADLRTLKDSVKHCSDTCDGVNEIKTELKELRKELQTLSQQNEKLRAENATLSERIEELEQHSRANNLEIKGVPDNGDVIDVLKRIGSHVHEPIADSDIDVCHRVPTFRPSEKNIIVRFVQRSKRDSFLQKCRKQRVTTKDLDYGGNSTAVYVNEHLTTSNKKLLGAAVARKKTAGWKFVWTAGGKIFARKDEDSRALRIACMGDIEKMTN